MGKRKNIEDSDAWKAADWEYAGLISQDIMPLLTYSVGRPLLKGRG